MAMHEADLPGVGRKFWMTTETGEKITLIRHNTGKRELYRFRKGEEFPSAVIELTEEEARQVGSVLSGEMQPRVVETMDVLMRDLVIDWIRLEPGFKATGRSIGQLEIRKRTGVSIMAILRGDTCIPNPSPDTRIQAEDVLFAIGKADQIAHFKTLLEKG